MKHITTKTFLAGAAVAGIVSGGLLSPAKAASTGVVSSTAPSPPPKPASSPTRKRAKPMAARARTPARARVAARAATLVAPARTPAKARVAAPRKTASRSTSKPL